MTPVSRMRSPRAVAMVAAAAVVAIIPSSVAFADIPGFTQAGTGPIDWTLNGNAAAQAVSLPTMIPGQLDLTSATANLATSAFYNTRQSYNNWTATYDYAVNSGAPTADGFGLVLQNAPAGANALGNSGGALGYGGIDKSVAFTVDLYNGNGSTAATRVGVATNGGGSTFVNSGTLNLRDIGGIFRFSTAYNDGVVNQTITKLSDNTTFSRTFNVEIEPRIAAGTAYVGFTGGTGGANAAQQLKNFTYTVGTAAAVAPRATVVAVPAAQLGAVGTWGVREVTNNGNINNLADAASAVGSPGTGARVVDYQVQSLDIFDSDIRGDFTNDRPFRTTTVAGAPSVGNIDNIALQANGVIRVPTAGVYTFAVRSDDDFRLTINGRRFETVSGDRPNATPGTVINANGALEFNGGRGAGTPSFGTVYLPAGDLPIQVLYNEGGGGSSLEVSAAAGVQTAINTSFNLVGAPAVPEVRENRSRYTGTVDASGFTVGRVNNINTFGNGGVASSGTQQLTYLLAQISARRKTGAGVFDAVGTYGTVNFLNTGTARTGANAPSDTPATVQPINSTAAVDDDNYGMAATARVTIGTGKGGRYTFNTYADDDNIFRIFKADGTTLVPLAGTNRTAVDSDGDGTNDASMFNGAGADNLARYDLTDGVYVVEAAFREGAGGSYFQLFGAKGDLTAFDNQQFQLIGQNLDTTVSVVTADARPAGLQLVPEPGSIGLLGLAAAGLLGKRRRRN